MPKYKRLGGRKLGAGVESLGGGVHETKILRQTFFKIIPRMYKISKICTNNGLYILFSSLS